MNNNATFTNCSTCGKKFRTFPYKIKNHKHLFCSTACQYKKQNKRINLTCRMCGTCFQMPKNRVDNQKECFCSKKCADEALKVPKITRNCETCGKEFSFLESRLKHSDRKFCSKKCHANRPTTSDIHKCLNCKKEFFVCKSAKNDGRGKYCSKECYVQYAVWDNSPSYQHGFACAKKLSKNNNIKSCEICLNEKKNLDLHHIDNNPFNNQKNNFIFLCRSCHMRVHHLAGKHQIETKKALDIYKIVFKMDWNSPEMFQSVEKLKLL